MATYEPQSMKAIVSVSLEGEKQWHNSHSQRQLDTFLFTSPSYSQELSPG
ncbi:hypothetical protein CK203_102008 [Vitis vinifera]|uniref:Uncharacterized protein n=1 Tax=Vitis vinifera TaxID=29760 RepID=A0A438D8J8_VITVI|nr:hypothetical protein CK203_102008 [Vitis vinifera]